MLLVRSSGTRHTVSHISRHFVQDATQSDVLKDRLIENKTQQKGFITGLLAH